MKRKYILWAIIAVGMIVLFDRAMKLDQKNLCENDATAYNECSKGD